MAAASDSKSSFLASLSPWGGSRTASPAPKSAVIEGSNREDRHLRQSSGQDHSISLRPSPGLKHYPRDCPPLKPRWFYAVDIPKRKPFAPETGETSKSSATPKKHVPFSESDSRSIESAFQAFGKEESEAGNALRSTKVPVNDDFLFDVNIENRELEPAYWIGPVYEVRRGSWFYQESAGLRPCDENLANQLEEGYIKVAPWRKPAKLEASRSASQPRGRPTSLILDSLEKAKAVASPSPRRPVSELREDGKSTEVSNQTSPERAPLPNTDIQPTLPKQQEAANTPSDGSGTTYRLFGAYMNSIVTYQDSSVAWLSTDDFMSRMSSSVYGRFGPTGTKIVRGYTKGAESSRKADTEEKQTRDDRRKAAQLQQADQPEAPKVKPTEPEPEDTPQGPPRRSALERQLSSLAGIPGAESKEDLAEEARQEEEKEMENYGEANASEQGREIEHLVLVTHGVGQRLGLRLDSINFIHDVNTLRKTMKAVYESAPDLQALNASVEDVPPNCRIQVLPVCWRHLLDFPKQSVRRNRKELDLADVDSIDEEDYPSLADITVDGVPAVRNLITDLAMDVLLYQSAYREHIAGIVQRECNRIYKLFKERNPSFSGRVSLVGHSLGSAILFDILCRQKDTGGAPAGTRLRMRSKGSKDKVPEQRNFSLDFDCENFFCLGSPIAMFQMLKGRTIAGRKNQTDLPAESPFDPDPMVNDPFGQAAGEFNKSSNLLPITISSPKCLEIYNIFHPTDPIAYRMEPLISPAMTSLKPQSLPYTKKGLFGAPGIANISARVGQSVGTMWYSLTSGVASSLINRSLGITGEEQALPQDSMRPGPNSSTPGVLTGTQTTAPADAPTIPVADGKKQQALADATAAAGQKSTLIDSEMETLFTGFQTQRRSHGSASSEDEDLYNDSANERSRRLKREEAKIRALNSNGRVDYSIQEGMFDVSLLASIASHLSYWADEDVNHFMIGQMLKRDRGKGS